MEAFTISSKFYVGRDDMIAKIAIILRSARAGDAKKVKRLVSQFRSDFPDFELDSEMNVALLYMLSGNREKCIVLFENIRNTSLKMGEKLLKARFDQNSGDLGAFDNLNPDVMKLVLSLSE